MSAEFIINDDIQVNLEESEIHHFKTGRTYPIGSNESNYSNILSLDRMKLSLAKF